MRQNENRCVIRWILSGEIVVGALAAFRLIVHLAKDGGFLRPGVQFETANAQWIFQILAGPAPNPSREAENAATLTFILRGYLLTTTLTLWTDSSSPSLTTAWSQ